jgi:hypothetical protein
MWGSPDLDPDIAIGGIVELACRSPGLPPARRDRDGGCCSAVTRKGAA